MVFAEQPRDAEFGHHGIGKVAWHRDQRAGLELRHDARNRAAHRGRLQQRNGASARTQKRADVSLRLSTGPVHHPRAEHGLRINLPGEVDADRVVDRGLPIIRGHGRKLERVFRIVKLKRRVVVDYPQVVRVRARPRDRHRLSAMDRLAPPVDYPGLYQPRDSRRAHLRMQPQVLLAVERAHPRHLRAGIADANLNRHAVVDQLAQISRDRFELDGRRRDTEQDAQIGKLDALQILNDGPDTLDAYLCNYGTDALALLRVHRGQRLLDHIEIGRWRSALDEILKLGDVHVNVA